LFIENGTYEQFFEFLQPSGVFVWKKAIITVAIVIPAKRGHQCRGWPGLNNSSSGMALVWQEQYLYLPAYFLS
jgi:hypothetical protein